MCCAMKLCQYSSAHSRGSLLDCLCMEGMSLGCQKWSVVWCFNRPKFRLFWVHYLLVCTKPTPLPHLQPPSKEVNWHESIHLVLQNNDRDEHCNNVSAHSIKYPFPFNNYWESPNLSWWVFSGLGTIPACYGSTISSSTCWMRKFEKNSSVSYPDIMPGVNWVTGIIDPTVTTVAFLW